jgi:hypothetical protein
MKKDMNSPPRWARWVSLNLDEECKTRKFLLLQMKPNAKNLHMHKS